MAADRNTDKKTSRVRPTVLVSALTNEPAGDSFDDEQLDDMLKRSLRAGGLPPRLILVDRLANRTRYRREC